MEPVRIVPKTKTVWHRNPYSGHEWSTQVPLKGYEVWGGGFFMRSFRTLKAAENEKSVRESINRKFPYEGYDKGSSGERQRVYGRGELGG
jgi:hypothetical protein